MAAKAPLPANFEAFLLTGSVSCFLISARQTVSLSGTITDKQSGAPIEKAQILLDLDEKTYKTTSRADGTYSIAVLPPR